MTPQQIEAMKLALTALKNAIAIRNGEGGTMLVYPLEENAITAIREALAEHAMRETQRLGQEIEQERNFCHRCGKRTKDIHTCTPPQENT